jgi:hypothetical protein
MNGFVERLFESFQPRQVCMNYETDVIVLNAVSDVLIMGAYYSIPLALLYPLFFDFLRLTRMDRVPPD